MNRLLHFLEFQLADINNSSNSCLGSSSFLGSTPSSNSFLNYNLSVLLWEPQISLSSAQNSSSASSSVLYPAKLLQPIPLQRVLMWGITHNFSCFLTQNSLCFNQKPYLPLIDHQSIISSSSSRLNQPDLLIQIPTQCWSSAFCGSVVLAL